MDGFWNNLLRAEEKKPYMQKLKEFLLAEKTSYPPNNLIFNALEHTPFEKVKVVIIGQDPYHGEGQAHGFCFSVMKGVRPPPSLQNIFKELRRDLGIQIPTHGCLEDWAKQGVLLLNATLTVGAKKAKSHYGLGWEIFTDQIVQALYEREDPMVFLLWGKSAEKKIQQKPQRHLVLTAPHPSPLSAYNGFFGCSHFSKANTFLKSLGKTEIDWSLS